MNRGGHNMEIKKNEMVDKKDDTRNGEKIEKRLWIGYKKNQSERRMMVLG